LDRRHMANAEAVPDEFELDDIFDRGTRDLLREIFREEYEDLIKTLALRCQPSLAPCYSGNQRMRTNSVLNSWLREMHVKRMSATYKRLTIMHALELYVETIHALC
jgi:hypothetical protein